MSRAHEGSAAEVRASETGGHLSAAETLNVVLYKRGVELTQVRYAEI